MPKPTEAAVGLSHQEGQLLRQEPRPWVCYRAGEAHLPFRKREHFCPRWPDYPTRIQAEQSRRARLDFIREGARSAINAIIDAGAPRATEELLTSIMDKKCVQRLCVRIQILNSKVYVVAPRSQKCSTEANSVCSTARRQRTEGVAMTAGLELGKWSSDFSPTSLEWHFVAGMNVSTCSAAVEPGDFNGAYSRLRLQTSLRLILEAARFRSMQDTEFILCVGETPLSAGQWCLNGAHSTFEVVSNLAAPSLPFPHWLPRLRDVDFSVWDEARAAQQHARYRQFKYQRQSAESKAVFRGGLYRLSVYSDRWRQIGARRTVITPENWRKVGRTALIHLLANSSVKRYLNAYVQVGVFANRLQISKKDQNSMDAPVQMSEAEQQRKFRFVLNIEGHGGWADRLYKLLLSNQLVLAQDVAAQLWFERFLQAGHTHLVVDSNLRNLTEVIRWAQSHDREVRRMVANANRIMEAAISVEGIRMYTHELLSQYTSRVLTYAPRRNARAVEFTCTNTGSEARSCEVPGRAAHQLQRTHCHFLSKDGVAFGNLHDAAADIEHPQLSVTDQKLPQSHESSRLEEAHQHRNKTSLQELLCSINGRANARLHSKWCYHFSDASTCHMHYVTGTPASGCVHRPCIWTTEFRPHSHPWALAKNCHIHQMSIDAPSCVAVCCAGICQSNQSL